RERRWASSSRGATSIRSYSRESSPATPRPKRGVRLSPVVFGNDLLGGDAELLEHALGRAEGPHDELRAASLDVFLDAGGEDLRGPERRARAHGRLVHATARNEGLGHGEGLRLAGGDGVVDQGAEVILGHLAPLPRGQLLDLLNAGAKLLRRD